MTGYIAPSIIGAAVVAIGIFGGIGVERVISPAPPPITVHKLTFQSTDDGKGRVVQERTVEPLDGASAFYAFWAAQVVDADTGIPVSECTGSGSWPYGAGRKEVTMTLARWTGGDLCKEGALPKRFYLQATWFWGASQTELRSETYTRADDGLALHYNS